eukprot:1858325-Amphidinium_carterae.1
MSGARQTGIGRWVVSGQPSLDDPTPRWRERAENVGLPWPPQPKTGPGRLSYTFKWQQKIYEHIRSEKELPEGIGPNAADWWRGVPLERAEQQPLQVAGAVLCQATQEEVVVLDEEEAQPIAKEPLAKKRKGAQIVHCGRLCQALVLGLLQTAASAERLGQEPLPYRGSQDLSRHLCKHAQRHSVPLGLHRRRDSLRRRNVLNADASQHFQLRI